MTRLVAGPATSPLAGAPPCSGSRLALGVRPTLDVLSPVEEPPRRGNQSAAARCTTSSNDRLTKWYSPIGSGDAPRRTPFPAPDALTAATTAPPRRFVAYLRVSTEGQGRSGLGLEVQRKAAATYLAQHGGELLAEFQEVESGRTAARPQLAAALRRVDRPTGQRLSP